MLVGKMVAVANYWRDLMFVASLLEAKPSELAPCLPRVQAMVGPFDTTLLSLAQVTEAEYGFASSAYASISPDEGDGWQLIRWYLGGGTLFYKRNATMNHAYRYYSALANSVFSAPAHRTESEWDAFSKSWHELPWWRYIYNPTGKMLFSVAMPAWHEYQLRVHDLDALNRLIALRIDILRSGVKIEQVPAALAGSASHLHDPYTLKPARWDAAKKGIYFEPRSARIKKLIKGIDNGRVFMGL